MNTMENGNPARDTTETAHGSSEKKSFYQIKTYLPGDLFSAKTLRKGIVPLIDQAIVSTTNFLTSVIVGRACSKEQFGLYMLGWSIVLFVTSLQESLISMPYMVYVPRFKTRERRYQFTGSTLVHQMGLGVLTAIVLAVSGMILSFGFGPRDLADVVWALVVTVVFILMRQYARRISFANLQFTTALFLDLTVAVIQISGLLLLSYLGLLSASHVYLVAGLSCCIAAGFWIVKNRNTIAIQFSKVISDLGHNWSLGKWVFGSGLLWAFRTQMFPWVLATFHGTAATGVLAACIGVVSIGNPVILGLQNYLGPKITHSFANQHVKALRRFVIKASVIYSCLIIPFLVILILLGGRLVTLLYGYKYSGNGFVVVVLAVNLIVSVIVFPFIRALFTIEYAHIDFIVNIGMLFIMFTIGFWLIKSFGPLGAAYGMLVTNGLSSAVKITVFLFLSRSHDGK